MRQRQIIALSVVSIRVILCALYVTSKSHAAAGEREHACHSVELIGLHPNSSYRDVLEFAKACPSGCPYAITTPNDFCTAQCATDVVDCQRIDSRVTLVNTTTRLCGKCKLANCQECEDMDTSDCKTCYPYFYNYLGKCILHSEVYIERIVTIFLLVLIGFFLFLLLCFGSVQHLVLKQGRRVAHRVLLQRPFGTEMIPSRYVDARFGSSASPRELMIREERRQRVETNWHVLKLGLATALKSSASQTFSRKTKRLSLTVAPPMLAFSWRRHARVCLERLLIFRFTGNHGIGMLLFRNTQRFFIMCCIVIWTAAKSVNDHSNISKIRDCKHDEKSGTGVDLEKCCSPDALAPLQIYAEDMIVMGLVVWTILALMTWLFCFLQMYSVSEDLFYQTKHGFNDQDYTLLLTNLPKHVTSEAYLMEKLQDQLKEHGKIYGVSIVYDLKQPEWRDRIADMCENLIISDIVDHYEAIADLYLRPKFNSHEELRAQLALDRRDLRDLLLGQGAFLQARSVKPIGTGEAYVVFDRKMDVKMTMPCISGIRWTDDAENPYQIAKVSHCEYTAADVIWMNCMPKRCENLCNTVAAAMLMFGAFGLMVGSMQLVFHSSIDPYISAGSNPAQHSKNYRIANCMLGLVNSLLPGMPAGLANGIGFTRQSTQGTFIVHFILGVFGIWIFTVMLVQWGTQGLRPFALASSTIEQMKMDTTLKEFAWAQIVIEVMVPGQVVIGYVVNEILTASIGLAIPTVVCMCVYVLRLFPSCFRKCISRTVLNFQDHRILGGRDVERVLQLQPIHLSMEYAFIIWVPLLSFSTFFFVTDSSPYMCVWLIVYSVLMLGFMSLNQVTMRTTTFDTTLQFRDFIRLWSKLLCVFPLISVWWCIRLAWIPLRMGTVFAGMTVALTDFFFYWVLDRMDFHKAMNPAICSQEALGKKQLEKIVQHDRPYEQVLDTIAYSWWNMNPMYVLKNRYCPDLPGHEVLPDTIRCWPKVYTKHTLVEIGREWRFQQGQDMLESKSRPRQSSPEVRHLEMSSGLSNMGHIASALRGLDS